MKPDVDDPRAKAMLEVLMEVGDERFAQEAKWGPQNRPWGGSASIYGRMVMYQRDLCEAATSNGSVTWRHILLEEVAEACAEENVAKARAELLQVAAVAVAAVESIDRGIAAEEGLTELKYGGSQN